MVSPMQGRVGGEWGDGSLGSEQELTHELPAMYFLQINWMDG